MDRILRWQMLTVCAGLLTTSLVWAENWPGWRGPRGDGSSVEQGIPTRWNGETGENIVWKTAVPGVGHASPIVWEDRIFTVSCLLESRERILLCFDRRTGGQLWQQTVLTSPLETKHHLNSHASGTPATDGRWVYVTFLEVQGDTIEARNVSQPRPVTAGRMVVAAYDFEGNQQWLVRPGEFVSVHGYCSCPVLFEDLVIVNGDHDGDSYLVALDKTTGQTVWKVDRQYNTREGVGSGVFDLSTWPVSLTISPASGEDFQAAARREKGNKNGIRPIGLDTHKLNTPGRESFSGKPFSMWLIVARKRLPTP
jgi:outer membrane protein assembly factor BamB